MHGSSPRLRGTRLWGPPRTPAARIIPAPAGNASVRLTISRNASDHPRACGERRIEMTLRYAHLGSSPRLRGTLVAKPLSVREFRIIPAPAGNAAPLSTKFHWKTDHPRACGERVINHLGVCTFCGSSPRLRGTPVMVLSKPSMDRIIPAPAGNAAHGQATHSPLPDHPRACGERLRIYRSSIDRYGSSPRLRGTRHAVQEKAQDGRIIPAPAGNASCATSARCNFSDHPRACGERRRMVCLDPMKLGSSPRLRGTRLHVGHRHVGIRIIPAPAGNACFGSSAVRCTPDHPRACGERDFQKNVELLSCGSSPRLRGTRLEPCRERPAQRIIPAPAGNACDTMGLDKTRSDHPRACGERQTRPVVGT